MTIVLLGLLLLGLVVLVVYVSGRSMTEHYESFYAASLEAPPERVFDVVLDVEQRPICAGQCKGVLDLEKDGDRWSWTENLGSSRVRYETTAAERPTSLVRRGADSIVPATFEQSITFEPEGTGTRLTSTTRTVVRDGTWHVPLFRFMLTMFDGANRANRDYLKRTAEALGETLELDA